MENLIQCAKCKNVSFVISKAKALKESQEYEEYYNNALNKKGLTSPKGIKEYSQCTYCGASYLNFREISQEQKDNLPVGITICPILDPKEII